MPVTIDENPSMHPVLSLVVVSYNYADYLEEAIQSCVAQGRSGDQVEVIVVDDGSTDHTPEVVRSSAHPAVHYVRLDNSGIEVASNTGFALANGSFVMRVDADDRLHDNYWMTVREAFTDQSIDFSYSNYAEIDVTGSRIGEMQLPPYDAAEIQARGDFLATGTCWRRDALARTGGYRTDKKNSGLENFALILGAIQSGSVGVHVAEVLFDYRLHLRSISRRRQDEITGNGRELFARMGLGTYSRSQYHPQHAIF